MTYDELESYWTFVNERQRIFRKKYLEGQEPPWTDDPILRDKHFTNVYRELDRVTRHYIENYVGEGISRDEAILSTVIYRIVNKPETMDIIGIQGPQEYDPEEIYKPVLDADLETTFSSAYMTSGMIGETGEPKIKSYAYECFGELVENWETYVEDHFDPATSPQEWITEINEIPGISDFIAYEIYTDLTYHEWFPWTENDYVNPGPGAKKGIQYLMGFDEIGQGEHRDIDYVDHIVELRDMQDEWVADDFVKWKDPQIAKNHGDLTLRAIEHTLCEYSKYRRYQEQEGGRLRNHDPSPEPLGIDDEDYTGGPSTMEDFL